MNSDLTSNTRVAALRHLHDKLKSGEYDGTDVMAAWIAVEDLACLLERTAGEPAATRKPDKFDMAFEIMRQLEAEDMETMQSCQFGYVMRVTRERVPSPPVTDYGVTPTLAAIRMAIKTFDEDRNERRVLEEIQETVRHALPPPATHQFSIGDKVRLGSGGMQREVVGIIERYRITTNAGASGWMAVDGDNLELVERASETKPDAPAVETPPCIWRVGCQRPALCKDRGHCTGNQETNQTKSDCPNCFGDRTVTMSDGSKRPCELCSPLTKVPAVETRGSQRC